MPVKSTPLELVTDQPWSQASQEGASAPLLLPHNAPPRDISGTSEISLLRVTDAGETPISQLRLNITGECGISDTSSRKTSTLPSTPCSPTAVAGLACNNILFPVSKLDLILQKLNALQDQQSEITSIVDRLSGAASSLTSLPG
ncbi:hypothetical protein QAD02_013175 [Eretmocerus hayati]|uniref:Uncharacterized protein n=1 Tax=Eretmocerus hayati TaxID=131215 RepID=A0ACC2P2R2_9HYME|nr:hypothetical protein QAD02_013175 [Eretmocerus hayati]